MQRHAKNILVYRIDTLQGRIFRLELFLLQLTSMDIRPLRENGAKVMHIDVSSAQGTSEVADLLSGNHGGKKGSIEYLPKVCLSYTTVKLVQSW